MEWIKRTFGNNDPEYILLIFLLFGFIGGTAGSYIMARQMQEVTPLVHFTILLEAVGTIATLLFIWATVIGSRKERLIIIEQARADRQEERRERKKERLRQQLQFYAPLVGRIRREDYKIDWKNALIDEIMEQNEVNTNYELYAENDLTKLLREYFGGQVRFADDYSEFGNEFESIVLSDFEKLREDYLSLMK